MASLRVEDRSVGPSLADFLVDVRWWMPSIGKYVSQLNVAVGALAYLSLLLSRFLEVIRGFSCVIYLSMSPMRCTAL